LANAQYLLLTSLNRPDSAKDRIEVGFPACQVRHLLEQEEEKHENEDKRDQARCGMLDSLVLASPFREYQRKVRDKSRRLRKSLMK